MRRFRLPLLATLPCVAALLLLPACSLLPKPKADPTRYYTLSVPSAVETATPNHTGALRLGLRKIELSPYLNKGLLVVRSNENEVNFDDYERWAEPLDAAISRILHSTLQADPRVARVTTPPLGLDEERDFDLIVRVRRADGLRLETGKGVRFVAIIEVHSTGAGNEILAQRTFTAPDIAWDGKDYNALAHGLSEAVQLLAKEIMLMLPKPATTGEAKP